MPCHVARGRGNRRESVLIPYRIRGQFDGDTAVRQPAVATGPEATSLPLRMPQEGTRAKVRCGDSDGREAARRIVSGQGDSRERDRSTRSVEPAAEYRVPTAFMEGTGAQIRPVRSAGARASGDGHG